MVSIFFISFVLYSQLRRPKNRREFFYTFLLSFFCSFLSFYQCKNELQNKHAREILGRRSWLLVQSLPFIFLPSFLRVFFLSQFRFQPFAYVSRSAVVTDSARCSFIARDSSLDLRSSSVFSRVIARYRYVYILSFSSFFLELKCRVPCGRKKGPYVLN